MYNEVPVAALAGETWKAMLAAAADRFALHRGRMVTVSTASGVEHRARWLARRWSPLAETLEGAAAALACLRGGAGVVADARLRARRRR